MIIGEVRAENRWIRLGMNFSWAVGLAFTFILMWKVADKQDDCHDKNYVRKDYTKKWCLIAMIILGVRVAAELIFNDLVGMGNNNIIEFIISVALYITLVLPWIKFYYH